jgi:hypothetical protein
MVFLMSYLISGMRSFTQEKEAHRSGSVLLRPSEASLVSEEEASICIRAGWGRRDWLMAYLRSMEGWGRSGQGVGRDAAKLSLRLWVTPHWLSVRLLFIQIRRNSGFADRLRFLNHVHLLTDLIFELQT